MIFRTSTLIAALSLLALPGWSADPATNEIIDAQQLFSAPPQVSKSERLIVAESHTPKFVIRDPAMAGQTPVKRASHEAELNPKRRVLLVQFGEEEVSGGPDELRDVTGNLELDLEANNNAERAAGDAANEAVDAFGFRAVDAKVRPTIRPNPERRKTSYESQPWTIPGLLDRPEDYRRQACEEEFCRNMWACAGGRQCGMVQRWRRDTRHNREFRSMGGCGLCNTPGALLSGLFMEPTLGFRLFGGRMGVCGCCQSTSVLWDDHCVNGAASSCYHQTSNQGFDVELNAIPYN
jgi:hypothetical protein